MTLNRRENDANNKDSRPIRRSGGQRGRGSRRRPEARRPFLMEMSGTPGSLSTPSLHPPHHMTTTVTPDYTSGGPDPGPDRAGGQRSSDPRLFYSAPVCPNTPPGGRSCCHKALIKDQRISYHVCHRCGHVGGDTCSASC